MSQKRLSEAPTVHPTAELRDCRLGKWTEVGARTKMAETTLGDFSYVVDDGEIIYTTIGKFANIAARVRINPGNHPMERASLHHFMYRSAAYEMGPDDDAFFDWRRSFPVNIGHDTWIGHGVVIMPGVRVGTGAVIGSGAVVTKDVPDYAIVVGVPAKVLRHRHPEAVRESLRRIAWWDWDHATVKARLSDFRALSAEDFCRKYDPVWGA